jgi:hypothetical protein
MEGGDHKPNKILTPAHLHLGSRWVVVLTAGVASVVAPLRWGGAEGGSRLIVWAHQTRGLPLDSSLGNHLHSSSSSGSSTYALDAGCVSPKRSSPTAHTGDDPSVLSAALWHNSSTN